MTRSTTKLATLFTVAVVALTVALTISLTASQAQADVYNQIDRRAQKIQRKTKTLLAETIHYRSTPQYLKLVQCTNELNRLATHIHEVTHFEGNLVRLRADLKALDAEFHSLEGLFDQVEESAAYGHGQIEGNTRHVKVLLNCIEDCIHDIQDCVETLVPPPVICPITGRVITTPKTVFTRPVVVTKPVVVNRPVQVAARPVYVPKRPVPKTTGISISIGGYGNDHGYSRSRGHYRGSHGYGRGRGHGGYSGRGFGFSAGSLHFGF